MIVCGIDTCTRWGEVAFLQVVSHPEGRRGLSEARVLGAKTFQGHCAHAAGLFPCLQELLRSCGLRTGDVDLISVDRGPGSYTGIRVGVTAAKVLAFALQVPVVAVELFSVLAGRIPDLKDFPYAACVLDAKLGQVYAALYKLPSKEFVFTNFVGEVSRLLPKLPEQTIVFGDGVERYSEFFVGFPKGEATWARPSAAEVARIGLEIYEKEGPHDPDTLIPLYLRLSVAEEKLKARGSTNDPER